ncbi:MAG: SIR2 family NAD-dependent protein deacylase [Acidobacteriota bacterium]
METVVVFSGAGLSAESGVPTFRDSNGLWEQHRVEDVASPEGWMRNRALVLNFYKQRFLKERECLPNAAHLAIGSLQERFHVVNITQNIDTLLERGGSQEVWHLHGRIDYQKCEHHYSIGLWNRPSVCSYRAQITRPIEEGDRCPECGAHLRPDVVWFGEAVDMKEEELDELVRTASVFIGIGTSALVYPAAGLLPIFRHTPEKYFIDPAPNYEMLSGYTVLEGKAADEMPKLARKLLGY